MLPSVWPVTYWERRTIQRREAGVCLRCPNGRQTPVQPGEQTCATCRDARKRIDQRRKERAVRERLCSRCRKRPAGDGYTCEVCLARRRTAA